MHLAYEILGLKPGDEVIVSTMTFIASTEPLRSIGAKPVFVDIDPISYNIDPAKIEEKITPRTKTIVVVHLHGNPCEMDEILAIAKKHGLKIIEDCAQAHLSEYKSQMVGNFGDIATLSFYPSKNLGAYGDAGAFLTNNLSYFNQAKLLVNHGRTEKYVHQIEGYNYRLDTIQAAILNVKLKYLNQWTERRILHAKKYIDKLKNVALSLPEYSDYKKHVFHIFAIVTDKRNDLIRTLKANQISSGIHYPLPFHLQPAYEHLGYQPGDLPVAERLSDQFLSLPMYAELTDENIDKICRLIQNSIAE